MMMWAIFGEDGMIESDFASLESAQEAILRRYTPDDDLHAGYECDDHPGHEHEGCEVCNSDDDE
jgi:hypothetical protein